MNYGNIKTYDIADGPGVRVSLFVSGCRNHCKGCFQPQTWDFAYGQEYTRETEDLIIESLKPDWISGLTVLGGEPFEPENQPEVLGLLRRVRAECPGRDVWCYSGYRYGFELAPGGAVYTRYTEEMLSLIDVLVDGRFIEEEKDLRLRFRGSRNQRLLDMARTRVQGRPVLWEG